SLEIAGDRRLVVDLARDLGSSGGGDGCSGDCHRYAPLDSYIDAAIGAEPAAIAARGLDRRHVLVRNHHLGGLGHRLIAVPAVEAAGLVAQRELRAAVAGLEPGLLERALELRRLAAQHVERLGLFDHKARGDLALAVHVEPYVDATELGRIEADLE